MKAKHQPIILYLTKSTIPWVDICCCFIDHQYVVFSKNGSGQTDQLTLTHTEVGSTLGHFRVQFPRKITHSRLQLNLVLKRHCIYHSFEVSKDTRIIEIYKIVIIPLLGLSTAVHQKILQKDPSFYAGDQ